MKRLSQILCVALVAGCGAAPPKVEFKYAEKRAVLDNGLKLVVIPDKNTQMIEVNVRYEVGSNEDPPGKAGLAHLVEHMMFQHHLLGPDKPATFELLPQIATFFNAYTIWEKTDYQLQARKENLEGLLRIEAARMAKGCESIPEDQFEREREVVRNEIRQRSGGAEGRVFQLILDAAYPEDHPYHETTGGDDQQLSSLTLQDVCTFMHNYYTPDRATVVVVGNVDVDRVGRLVAEDFGNIPARKGAPRAKVTPVADFHYQVFEHELDTERSQVHVLWKMPPIGSDDWPAARALVGAMTSRVAKFAEDWDFAASVSGGLLGDTQGPAYAPIYVLSLELYDAGDVDEALNYVWKATKSAYRSYEDGVFDKETKNLIKANMLMNLEPLNARAEFVADRVQFEGDKAVKFGGSGEYLIEALDEIDQLSGSEFRDFIKGRLSKSNAHVVIIKSSHKGKRGDKRSGLKFTALHHEHRGEPLIDAREAMKPLVAPETGSVLPRAQRYTLDNGMKVVLLPLEGGMPLVSARLLFGAGSAIEPPDKAGLAQLTARFLQPPRNSDFIRTGVSFGSGADSDTTVFTSRGMNIYLEVVIKGLERITKVGYLGQKGIESWQKRMKVTFDSQRVRQQLAYRKAVAAALFGEAHPYATTGSPTPESYKKMGRDRLLDFKSKHYTAANATLILVGAFDPAKAKSIIEDSFGSWGSGHRDEPAEPAARQRQAPEYIGVVGKAGPQMTVTIAYPGPAGVDGQYAARLIVAQMLNQRMGRTRTELGSTYGTYGSWSASVGPSAYVMGGTVDAERAGESLSFMRHQILALREGQDFNLEFARARRIVLKRLLAEPGETYALAARLGRLATFDLPPDFYDNLVKFVASASVAQVKALMQAEIVPGHEVVVCMADRATLEKAFSEAELQGVRYIEPK